MVFNLFVTKVLSICRDIKDEDRTSVETVNKVILEGHNGKLIDILKQLREKQSSPKLQTWNGKNF